VHSGRILERVYPTQNTEDRSMTSDSSVLEANRPFSRRLAANLQDKSGKAVITGSMIFRQVYHDLFGSKDAQDASTLTYTWVDDQFGHVTLGFIVTLLLCAVVSVKWSPSLVVVWAAILVAVLITVKEAYDYFCELKRRDGTFPFPFDRADVLLNCATSCIYTWIGAILAVVAVRFPLWSLLAAPVLVVVSLPIAAYWLRRKVALQQSDVPFLYRLANFPQNFAGSDGPDIITNLYTRTGPQHVVLTGPLNSGKTSLAVGTATEFGYRVGLCRYISLVKLAQTGQGTAERRGLHRQTVFQDGRTIWPLDDVDLLVVDDADGGIPTLEIDPDKIKEALVHQLGEKFLSLMKQRRTLWVAGTNDRAELWQQLVADLLTDGVLTRVGKVALAREGLQSTVQTRQFATAKARLR
jgi:hypothetical protein